VISIEPENLTQKEMDSKVMMEKKEKTNKISEAKIYWVQIMISIIFGIMTYYILEYTQPSDYFSLPLGGFFIGFGLMAGIYGMSLLTVPILIYHFKGKTRYYTGFRKAIKSLGTQIALYFLICGFVFMINI
jgi:magnesium-transporting ATPase (P-type)